jgi:hypothetical protein
LLLWKKASGRRALGAQRVTALLFSQGHHLDHGAKTAAFTAAQASVAKGVEDISHLLREGLGDVEGAEPPEKAGGELLAERR